MKETGIIMSGDHPRKILDGIKTMTRRTYGLEKVNDNPSNWFPGVLRLDGRWSFLSKDQQTELVIKCPYGGIGDLLWVRETWKPSETIFFKGNGKPALVYYKADGEAFTGQRQDFKWKSSMFMPRWASRITREITGLRAERVQEITWRDCKREGAVTEKMPFSVFEEPWKDAFERLWDSLNAKRGYGWYFNPWVWPISF